MSQTSSSVVFVCPHGAGMSRLAAAFFNQAAPPGWHATSAGLEPAAAVNPVAASLVTGSPTETYFDQSPPRALDEVEAVRTVAINCAVPGAERWHLATTAIGEPMCEELRSRAEHLATELTDARP